MKIVFESISDKRILPHQNKFWLLDGSYTISVACKLAKLDLLDLNGYPTDENENLGLIL